MAYSHGYFDVVEVGPRRTYVNRFIAGRYDLDYLEVGGRANWATDDEEIIIRRAIDALFQAQDDDLHGRYGSGN